LIAQHAPQAAGTAGAVPWRVLVTSGRPHLTFATASAPSSPSTLAVMFSTYASDVNIASQ